MKDDERVQDINQEDNKCTAKDFFNQRAPRWDEMCNHNPIKVQRIVSLLAMDGTEVILDVGTGTGVLIPFYERHLSSGNVVAIDISDRMIEMARTKFPKEKHPWLEFKVQDLYDTIYTSTFDVVMCYSCFPHFSDKKRAAFLLSRALKPGGKLAIAHSDSRDKINRVHTDSGGAVSEHSLPPIKEMKQLAMAAGLNPCFEQDDQEYYMLIATKGHHPRAYKS